MRVAILDDYQQVALASADGSRVRERAAIHVFTTHIGRTEARVNALEPFDVIVAMRERTPFDAERLGQLPRLRLLVTTGMSNASIDLDAAAARGITVCGTGGAGASTADLTSGLFPAPLPPIPTQDRATKVARPARRRPLGGVAAAGLVPPRTRAGLGGAALGVSDAEPLPLSSPLRTAPNVVLTPHLGYVTEEAYRIFYGDVAEDIVAFAAGTPVRVLSA